MDDDQPSHAILGGSRLELDSQGRQQFYVECRCGWRSAPARTSVLSDADAEQHLLINAKANR